MSEPKTQRKGTRRPLLSDVDLKRAEQWIKKLNNDTRSLRRHSTAFGYFVAHASQN